MQIYFSRQDNSLQKKKIPSRKAVKNETLGNFILLRFEGRQAIIIVPDGIKNDVDSVTTWIDRSNPPLIQRAKICMQLRTSILDRADRFPITVRRSFSYSLFLFYFPGGKL